MPINKKITMTIKLNTIDMAFKMVFRPRKTINGTGRKVSMAKKREKN